MVFFSRIRARLVAATLSELEQRHSKALLARSVGLESADRFYCEALTCQWRIDGLDAQLGFLEELTSDVEGGMRCHAAALERTLEVLREQRASAIANLWGCVSVDATAIGDCYVDSSKKHPLVEREAPQSLRQYLTAANATYDGIMEETKAMVDVLPVEDVQRLYSALWRRRTFWSKQLEETLEEWQSVTASLHMACDDAEEVWSDIMNCVRSALRVGPSAVHGHLLQDLAEVAARAFEVEFLHFSSQPEILSKVLDGLLQADSLHLVGRALITRCSTVVTLPSPQAALVTAAAAGDSDSQIIWLSHAGAEGRWLIWLAVTLVETMCEASETGDATFVDDLVDFCTALAGSTFAGSVLGALSSSPKRANTTPVELALSAGHDAVADLLQCKIAIVLEQLQTDDETTGEDVISLASCNSNDHTAYYCDPDAENPNEAPISKIIDGVEPDIEYDDDIENFNEALKLADAEKQDEFNASSWGLLSRIPFSNRLVHHTEG